MLPARYDDDDDGISTNIGYLMLNHRYTYSRYHTITVVCTTALLLTKPSSGNDSRFRHGFGAEASLSLALSTPAVPYDITRLCQIVVTLCIYIKYM